MIACKHGHELWYCDKCCPPPKPISSDYYTPNWVSITSREPDPGKLVLVYHDGHIGLANTFYGCAMADWRSPTLNGCHPFTHWAYPAPPKDHP